MDVAAPRFFNRELSWLAFNERVLAQAENPENLLLERVKFLAICHSNLDEFFMIRVPALKEAQRAAPQELSPDGLTVRQQLQLLRERVTALLNQGRRCFEQLREALAAAGVRLLDHGALTPAQAAAATDYFHHTVYPILTPLAVDPGHPFPHISNQSLNLAVVVRDPAGVERFARVKIPATLPRLLPLPADGAEHCLVWLEQLVAAHLPALFRGMTVLHAYAFRVIRDADLEIRAEEFGELREAVEEGLSQRRFGSVTRLTVSRDMPEVLVALLRSNLEIGPEDVYPTLDVLGLADLMALHDLDLPALKDPPLRAHAPAGLRGGGDLFAWIREQDRLLHHPYDSFNLLIDLMRAAASDPQVLAIKQTIYRVGHRSPIVAALQEAGEEGKQVAAVVELKARFDEERNIEWARALEDAGVHVVYGDVHLKTHCKLLLVVRQEADGLRRYVHLSTGNYNARTAGQYTDLGLLTCDALLAEDVSALFNALTGYSENSGYHKLLTSPGGIRAGLYERIEREIAHARAGREGHLIFKVNAITDIPIIEALYRASEAGVRIQLLVRGVCMLVPGAPGLSERIEVLSVIGRFLEHSRIFYFRNGGGEGEELWLGSADIMRRNFDRRVEVLFPIERPELRRWLVEELLAAYLRDTSGAWLLQPDGRWERRRAQPGEAPESAQEALLQRRVVTPA